MNMKMRGHYFSGLGVAIVATLGVCLAHAQRDGHKQAPIHGVELPEQYREWPLIAPAHEAAPFDELRVVLGNPTALRAYRDNARSFPDGAVLVKLAWKQLQSPDFKSASIPGAATTVQVMVKDSKRYAATGGWGYGRFVGGQPADEAQHQTCHACHAALVKDRDYVFTRFAP